MLWTLFYITYGCSKFFSGIISDRANPRYFHGIRPDGDQGHQYPVRPLVGTLDVCRPLDRQRLLSGLGWPCSKLLTSWYSRTERGVWWSVWNTAHNVGGRFIPSSSAPIALQHGWRYGMIVPGLIAIVAGCSSAGGCGIPEPPWGRSRWESGAMTPWSWPSRPRMRALPPPDPAQICAEQPYIWLLACCYVLVHVVRTAINDWGNLYMTGAARLQSDERQLGHLRCSRWGFIGALVAGWGSGQAVQRQPGPMNLIFAVGILLAVGSLWLMPFFSYVMQAACFFTIGFFVFWPQMLIGMAAAGVLSTKTRRGSHRLCRTVCLHGGGAVGLSTRQGDGDLALERLLRGHAPGGGRGLTAC